MSTLKYNTGMKETAAMRLVKINTLLAILCCQQVYADEKRIIYDFEYGVFSYGAENYEEGDRSVSSDGELEKTTVISAKLGTKFGVRYWLSRAGFTGKPTLHLIYHVPTMINPTTGEYLDKIEVLQEEAKLDYKHTMAFEFAQQYELVPGEYRFYVFFENQKLIEKVFQVEIQ